MSSAHYGSRLVLWMSIALLVALVMIPISPLALAPPPNDHSRWRLHPTHPNPDAVCATQDGSPGHEYYLDSDNDGEHDHVPGTEPPQAVPSEPVRCFRD